MFAEDATSAPPRTDRRQTSTSRNDGSSSGQPSPGLPTEMRMITIPSVGPTEVQAPGEPVVTIEGGRLGYGDHLLFEGLDLAIAPGEFVALLGPNGAGKTSLIRVLLGLEELTAGTVTVCGRAPGRARAEVGYVPQQRAFDPDLPIRGRDLVQLGLEGTRVGLARSTRRSRAVVDRALDEVGARSYADEPLGRLSGGEQQRLRVAQALLTDPRVLLCDEPLLSLDPAHQQQVCELLDRRRRDAGTSVLFITHEINPVLPYVDRVLYLAAGRWAVGTPSEVLDAEQLTRLYGSPVEVVRLGDRIVIVGGDADAGGHHLDHGPPRVGH